MSEENTYAYKRELFLEALAKGLSVTSACNCAQVSRPYVYSHRKQDEAFAAAWDDAEIAGVDYLQDEARRRAVEGCPNYVLNKGEIVTRLNPETLEFEEVIKREYSDTLLMMLLKARDPARFCERTRTAMIEREWKLKEAEQNAGAVADSALLALLDQLAADKAALVEKVEKLEAAERAGKVPNAA